MVLTQPNRVEEVARGPLPRPLMVTSASRHRPRLCLALESLVGLIGLLDDPAWLEQALPDGARPSGGSVDELLAVRHG
jgi:hypothetical protein